jgi:hypothetical protein
MARKRKRQEQAKEPPTPTPRDDRPLTIEEADAYAHILMLAKEQQTRATSKAGEAGADNAGAGLAGLNTSCACARRFLIHWFDGERAKKAMEAAGCNWGDITAARFSDPDYKIAFELSEFWMARKYQATRRGWRRSFSNDAGARTSGERRRPAKDASATRPPWSTTST